MTRHSSLPSLAQLTTDGRSFRFKRNELPAAAAVGGIIVFICSASKSRQWRPRAAGSFASFVEKTCRGGRGAFSPKSFAAPCSEEKAPLPILLPLLCCSVVVEVIDLANDGGRRELLSLENAFWAEV